MAYSALQVADYFIAKGIKEGVRVDPLKVQKLVYFAHGLHLGAFLEPLIKEPVMAWTYGPVVENVYREFKRYGGDIITEPSGAESIPQDDVRTEVFLDEVWDDYSRYSGPSLSTKSHHPGGPWALTLVEESESPFSPEIPVRTMAMYFESQVQANQNLLAVSRGFTEYGVGVDPLTRALFNAPIDDEPDTDDEDGELTEARQELARGEGLSTEEIMAGFGIG